jgi:hypothetical protein
VSNEISQRLTLQLRDISFDFASCATSASGTKLN